MNIFIDLLCCARFWDFGKLSGQPCYHLNMSATASITSQKMLKNLWKITSQKKSFFESSKKIKFLLLIWEHPQPFSKSLSKLKCEKIKLRKIIPQMRAQATFSISCDSSKQSVCLSTKDYSSFKCFLISFLALFLDLVSIASIYPGMKASHCTGLKSRT